MAKARVLLTLIALVSGSWVAASIRVMFDSVSDSGQDLTMFGAILGILVIPAICVSALIMLGFSFFHATTSETGALVYNPKNLYWKSLKKFAEIDGPISLCRAFWLTFMVAMSVYWVLIGIFGVILAGVLIYSEGMPVGFSAVILYVVCFCAPLFLGLAVGYWNEGNKHPLKEKIVATCMVIFLVNILVIAPFTMMIYGQSRMSIGDAASTYGLGVCGFLLLALCLTGVVYGAVWLIKRFASIPGDSLLKRLGKGFKEKMCPILYEAK